MYKVYRAKLCIVSVLNYPRTFLDIPAFENCQDHCVKVRKPRFKFCRAFKAGFLFVRIKSMHQGLADLKQVDSLTVLAKL